MESAPTSRRSYFAFISYSHADNREEGRRWGNWLHQAMESYEVPGKLSGQEGKHGNVIPHVLFPVFRDEEEFSADGNLKESIEAALRDSEFLVVICSPRSAHSPYVDAEVRYFKELPGKHSRIIGLIVDGEPFASVQGGEKMARECLPPSFRTGVPRTDGTIDWSQPAEPLCADTRLGGQDIQGYTSATEYRTALEAAENPPAPAELRRLTAEYTRRLDRARMKIIAGVMGVRLGTLIRETNEFRVQRLRRALLVVGSLATAALIAAGWALWAQHRANRERLAAEHANTQANRLITEMLGDLGDKLRPIGKLELLGDVSEAAQAYFTAMPEGQDKHDVILQRAIMWLGRGDVLEAGGEEDAALKSYLTAQATLAPLGGGAPEASAEVRRYYAVTHERISDALEEKDVKGALEAAGKANALIESLIESPDGLSHERLMQDLGQVHERLGDIWEDGKASLGVARNHFEKSQQIRRHLAEEHGEKQPAYRRDYGVACGRIGDVLKMEGRFEEATRAYQEGLEARRTLLRNHGLNAKWIGEISRSHDSLGHAYEAMGRLDQALASHQQALEIRRDLSAYDPPEKKLQADLARSLVAVARLEALADRQENATRLLGEALAIQSPRIKGDKPDIKVGIDLITTLRLDASWHRKRSAWKESISRLDIARAAIETLRKARTIKAADNDKLRLAEARICADMARIHLSAGQESEAVPLAEQAHTAFQQISIRNPENSSSWRRLTGFTGCWPLCANRRRRLSRPSTPCVILKAGTACHSRPVRTG